MARAGISDIDQCLRRYLRLGILLSLLFHLILAIVLGSRRPTPIEAPLVIDVVYEKTPPIQNRTRQIVTPPKQDLSEKLPRDPKYLSERDSFAEKEQIKRGAGEDASRTVSLNKQPARESRPKREKQEQKVQQREQPKPPPQQQQLKLSDPTLLDKIGSISASNDKTAQRKDSSEYSAFSRPSGSGAQFLGVPGTTDYLPNLPDGDITLLNAKAERFAVFVRRVATQVFSQLRVEGWEEMTASDVRKISEFSVVRAILSPHGVLLKVILESPSGSDRFDEVLLRSVRKAARDPNPPPLAAASDGNFHFIFQSKSWSRFATAARSGAPFEQRWLLLSTGLE